MLTEEQQQYFFKLYKRAIYQPTKEITEELFNDTENPKTQIKRNRLLADAEKDAEKLARKIVNKIKKYSIEELDARLKLEPENFGDDLLTDIKSDLEK